jgi:hypothetical protein
MAFDGRDYTSTQPVPRSFYHPEAPHVGYTFGQILRNGYAIARHRGVGFSCYAAPLEQLNPEAYLRNPDRIIQTTRAALRPFWRDTKWVGTHWTHAVAHVTFTVHQANTNRASFRLRASNTETGSEVDGTILDLELADSSSRVQQGVLSPFQSPFGSYEALFEAPLAGVTRNALVTITAFGSADGEIRGTTIARPFEIDSVSGWLECRG